MAKSQQSRNMSPGRALALMALVLAVVFGGIGISVATSDDAQWTPKLGLDLEGGSTITLTPTASQGSKVTSENIGDAISIIRQRIDASGVGEASVTSQGTGTGRSIVVAVPGKQNNQLLEDAARTAQLRIRQVLAQVPATQPAVDPSASAAPEASAAPAASTGAASPKAAATAKASPSASGAGRTLSKGLVAAAAAPTQIAATLAPNQIAATIPTTPIAATVPPAPAPAASEPAASEEPAASDAPAAPAATGLATPAPAATDTAAVSTYLQTLAKSLATQAAAGSDVSGALSAAPCPPGNRVDPTKDPDTDPVIACDESAKYLLAKADLVGKDISSAEGRPETNSQGVTLGTWEVGLDFTGAGDKKWSALTLRVSKLVGSTTTPNLIAVELDGGVISVASVTKQLTGDSVITGNFSSSQAKALGRQIKFGALPLSFEAGNAETISASLGSDQLNGGLLAGGLGLLLVIIYSLIYYRGLGLVSVASLFASAGLTYGLVVFLSNVGGLRLSLSSIAGLIVAIGITADSFIVYFERLRDEVREGRTLRVAVETGWTRARRTILTADFVSFLAAAVLYVLSVGSVRGFAFTLGLTTIVDVVIVFLFTKPLVSLAARSSFFTGGHPWSGLDPRRLGAKQRPAVVTTTRTRTRSTAPTKEA